MKLVGIVSSSQKCTSHTKRRIRRKHVAETDDTIIPTGDLSVEVSSYLVGPEGLELHWKERQGDWQQAIFYLV